MQMGTSIANGVMSSKSAKRAKELQDKYIAKKRRDNEETYMRKYNESALDRAENQLAATRLAEAIKERNQQVAGRGAIMGNSEEAVMAQQAQNAKVQADMFAEQAAKQDERKDNAEKEYITRRDALDEAQMTGDVNYENQRGQAINTAMQGAMNAASTIASSLDSIEPKKDVNTTPNAVTTGIGNDSVQRGIESNFMKNQQNELAKAKANLNNYSA